MKLFETLPPNKRRLSGFTMIELMVALVIGLFIVGGAISVFVANQTTYRTKVDLDNAQEAFRFASHSIARVVRLGDRLEGSSGDQLSVTITGGPGVLDCLGMPIGVGASVVNTFSFDAGSLVCEGQVLVRGLASISFEYGNDGRTFAAPSEAQLSDAIYWDEINSVRATIAMADSGIQSVFAASMRPMIVAMHGGSGSPPGGNNGPGNGENGGGENGGGENGGGENGGGENGGGENGGGENGGGENGGGENGGGENGGGTQMCVTEYYGTKHNQGTVEVVSPSALICGSETGRSYSCVVTTEMSVSQVTLRHVRPGQGPADRNAAVNCDGRRQVNF